MLREIFHRNRMTKLNTFVFIGLLATTHLVSAQCELPVFKPNQIVVKKDIFYGQALNVDMKSKILFLDLYYPDINIDITQSRPLVVLLHGGWFKTGGKSQRDIEILCTELAVRGFVCSAINYRLGHDGTQYGQYKARYRGIQDANAALRFLTTNADKYNIDENWVFIGGQSAGAVIAYGVVHADETECDSVSLVMDGSLISEELGDLKTSGNGLRRKFSVKGLFNNWGAVPSNEIETSELLPTIAFHGALDTLVELGIDSSYTNFILHGSEIMNEKLAVEGICSELNVDLFGGHGIFRFDQSAYRARRASCFFRRIMCNECQSLSTTDTMEATCPTYDYYVPIAPYPNPTKDYIYLNGLQDSVNVKVYNSAGKLIENLLYPSQIDISNQPNGLYIIEVIFIESGTRPLRLKVIKK